MPDESPMRIDGFADLVKANQPTPTNAQDQKYEACLKSMASRQYVDYPTQFLQASAIDKKQGYIND